MLRAYFRNMTPQDHIQFHDAKCLLPISVGQKYHESDYLSALIDLINSKFHSCLLVICDSLYRHTMMIDQDYTKSESYHLSIKRGEAWLHGNKQYYSKLTIPTKIVRWDYWVFKNKAFLKYKKSIENLYHANHEFKLAFDHSVDEFISRYSKNNKIIDFNRASQLCLEYLKEECAALIVMWKQEKYKFLIYPSHPVEAIQVIFKDFVSTKQTGFVEWLRPKFIESLEKIEYFLDLATNEEFESV